MGADRIGPGGGSLGVATACVVVAAALCTELAGQIADSPAGDVDPRLLVRLASVGSFACLMALLLHNGAGGRDRRSHPPGPGSSLSQTCPVQTSPVHASPVQASPVHASPGRPSPSQPNPPRRTWPPPIRPRPALALLATTLALVAWTLARTSTVMVDDLARLVPLHPHEEGPFVRLRGTVLDHPIASARSGSMAIFDTRPPRWRLRLDAALVAFSDRPAVPCRGRVMIGVAGEAPRVGPGEWVEVQGSLSGFSPRVNPGGFDGRAWARREGLSASMWLDDPGAIRSAPRPSASGGHSRNRSIEVSSQPSAAPPSLVSLLLRARDALRQLAEEALTHDLPTWTSAETRALLLAMFLGTREPALADLEAAFRRTGSMHLVAISGFNLAVLAAAALAVARLAPRRRAWSARATDQPRCGPQPKPGPKLGPKLGPELRPELQLAARLGPWLVIFLVTIYLCIVEAQPAVLRAGAMILIARLGEALGRHWTAHGIYCLAAVLLLAVRPADIGNAGFQLSFAVVAALIWLAPRLQRRWFGPLPADGASVARVLARRLAMAVAAAMAAWLAATPLSLHHFGIVSPLAAPLSLLAVPLASGLLVVGYAKMLLTPFVPLSGAALGWPLATLATLLGALVKAADRIPGAAIALPAPGPAWTLVTLALLCLAVAAPRLLMRRAGWAGLLLCAAWPARAFLPAADDPALRVDMLAVGDGSCLLLRTGHHAILFDAGSLDVSIGDHVVVPALHALGVRSLDAIIVSHANLDHFDAVVEVVDALDVREVMLTRQFLHAAAGPPDTAPALLRMLLEERGIRPTIVQWGDERRWGPTRWSWLHPAPEDRPRRVNDTSQVILVEVKTEAGVVRVLLCGDIEAQAMEALRVRSPALAAEIVEMPHHGSWRDTTVEFLERLQPRLLLQSTGRRRLLDDRWSALVAAPQEGGRVASTNLETHAARAWDPPAGAWTAIPIKAGTTRPIRLMTARDGACRVEIDGRGAIRAAGFGDEWPSIRIPGSAATPP